MEYYINKAIDVQTCVGYKSGVLFALVAKGFVALEEKNIVKFEYIIQQIDELINEINVYHYLKLPFIIVRGNQNVEDVEQSYTWINYEYTVQYINAFLQKLRNLSWYIKTS